MNTIGVGTAGTEKRKTENGKKETEKDVRRCHPDPAEREKDLYYKNQIEHGFNRSNRL
jgi:hypothetical protein